MIKFGISENYVPNWGVVQAIREIYQNFIDYGDFEVTIDKITDTQSSVRISNNFSPENWEFLKIGFSKKKEGSIGQHGEGLKLAGLIFKRSNKMFRIYTPIGRASAAFYEDERLGTCYGLDISEMTTDKFEVYFEADNKDIEVFQDGYIKKEDILHSSHYGNIVEKKAENIYVGGLYVCKLEGLKYAIDFKPNHVGLGRDRDVPSTWDMEYYTNLIINSCSDKLEFKASDVNNREFNTGSIPNELSGKFKPVYSDSGDIQMRSGKTIVTDEYTISKITKNPVVAKRVEKLKYSVIFKSRKIPSTVLKELKDNLNLTEEEKIRFDSVIKLSKGWKVK